MLNPLVACDKESGYARLVLFHSLELYFQVYCPIFVRLLAPSAMGKHFVQAVSYVYALQYPTGKI